MLGTAWPSVRQTFHVPVGDLGLVLVVVTLGSVAVSSVVGRLINRFGVGALLGVSAVCAAVGAAGFAASPDVWVLFGVSVLFGAAAGMMDGGLNTAIGMSGRQRLLNLLHGAYGVGTAIGPLVVTLAVVLVSWRLSYVVLLAVDLTLAALWVRWRQAVPRPAAGGAPAEAATAPGPRAGAGSGQVAAVWAGLVVFFVYTGLEVSAGQWETTFNQGHLHLSESAAGIATFGYWAALTMVRISLALVPRPPTNESVVRWGSALAMLATVVIWWQPGTPATLVAFAVLGGALAGVFPALIALTPRRVGDALAHHAIAWQVGAAAAGGAALSALVGLLISTAGLAVVGPALVVMAALLLVSELVLGRLAPPLATSRRATG
jgi:fucose permease